MKTITIFSAFWFGITILGAALLTSAALSFPAAEISGVVLLPDGQAAVNARVRIQTTDNLAYTTQDGSFSLGGLQSGTPLTVTAWLENYKIGYIKGVIPPANNLTLTLGSIDPVDHPGYQWWTSFPDPLAPSMGCGHCMYPSYTEWQHSAHSQSATDPRFFSIYNGTNLSATQTISPGFKLDNPSTSGICAACHAPGAAADAPYTTDMNTLTGVSQQGVFCEFCHKIGGVYLDPLTGLPQPDKPGVLSLRLFRPQGADNVFFGTLDDVTRRVSAMPLEQESEFCAPCHQFSFQGVPVFESYHEWLDSPYAAAGVECQDCHQPADNGSTFVLPEKGGLLRDPATLPSHKDLSLKDTHFMTSTVAVTSTLSAGRSALNVQIQIKNIGAGHHVPTDYPGRHLLLTVQVFNQDGQPLTQLGGSQVPAWGGAQAGLPGKAFAKVLKDTATGAAPVVSYWRPTTQVDQDTRIPAMSTDVSNYFFTPPQPGAIVTATARLVFRRMYQSEMTSRDWLDPDIPIAQQVKSFAYPAMQAVFLPYVQRSVGKNNIREVTP